MNRLVFAVGSVIAVVLMTESASARDRYTTIRLTNNIGTRGQFNTKCVAIVETEIVGVRRASKDVMHWIIENGNSFDRSADFCPNVDEARVELRFMEPVFGYVTLKAEQVPIHGTRRWVVRGTVAQGIAPGRYKYRVWYTKKNASNPDDKDPAGPDPDVEVDCGGCFPP